MASIAERVSRARERIAAACLRVGRDPASVRIVAVSKTQPAAAVTAAAAAGVEAIGENRVQEAVEKRSSVAGATPWRLVGHLQGNKARLALTVFDAVDTLDSPALADRLERLLAPAARVLPVLVEVNVAAEASKSGVAPAAVEALAAHVLARCPHLRLAGLLAVPPWSPEPERVRPNFAALRRLSEGLSARLALPPLELSMGMSEDFEVAVEEGATWVRLGRVLFGERRASTIP